MITCTRRGPSPCLMTETACARDRAKALEHFNTAQGTRKGKGRRNRFESWDQYVHAKNALAPSISLIECLDCEGGLK